MRLLPGRRSPNMQKRTENERLLKPRKAINTKKSTLHLYRPHEPDRSHCLQKYPKQLAKNTPLFYPKTHRSS